MIAYENTLKQFKKDVRAKRLVNFLCAEHEAATGKAVSGQLRYVWKYALNILYTGLAGMGGKANPKSGIRIDLEDNASATHMKLIFASASEETYRYAVLGLYAGSSVAMTNADDIVRFREGNTLWTMVHPSLLMSSYAKRLFRGMPSGEAGSVNYESAAWLFDCFFSCDTDIITDYNAHLTDEFPVFYANDQDDVFRFLEGVLAHEGGQEALRRLNTFSGNSASRESGEKNADQIYLISSITNNVRRSRKAWYIIEGQIGTGKDEIIRGVTGNLEREGKTVEILKNGTEPAGSADLVVISEENGRTFEQLDNPGVSVFLCDGLGRPDYDALETDAVLASLAEESGAQLYIFHLKQNDYFADGGKGMRWLVNRLQLADIPREDCDPELYQISLVNSKEDFSVKGGEGMANVVLPPNMTYNKETGLISAKKAQKKGIYNALSAGRKGVLILCTDPELKKYLESEISALRQRQKWIRNFVSDLIDGKKLSEREMNRLNGDNMSAGEKRAAEYGRKVRAAIGSSAWDKTDERSRTWIISALMAYDSLKSFDRMVDFSGVCVQIGKACENELKKRLFTAYLDYLKERYGEDRYLEKIPPECFAKSAGGSSGPRELLPENRISMGKMRYIMGLDDSGRIVNQAVWKEFETYCREALLVNSSNPLKVMRSQLPVINKIKDDYRNRSAHSHAITIVDAKECIEYVITVHKKLGVLLDQYRV